VASVPLGNCYEPPCPEPSLAGSDRRTSPKRGASKGTGSGAGAMTVSELQREAARLGIDGEYDERSA
jgi:hypothetical protein